MAFLPHQSLSDTEIQDVVRALEKADESHLLWLQHFHSSLICCQPFRPDEFHERAHTLCEFGRWYYNEAPTLLRDHPGFAALDDVHRMMHQCARHIVQRVARGGRTPVEDYEKFVNQQCDMSQRLRCLRDELKELHYSFDSLTGAVNRQAFFRMLAQEYERAKRTGENCTLALADIDHFKSINDTYGHLSGDRVLQAVAHSLYRGLRKYDCVCRFGGEEFLMFMPGVSAEQAMDILDRVRDTIARTPIRLEDGTEVTITTSFGVAALDIRRPPDISIERADRALYQAKESGRNRVVCLEN